MLWSIVLLFARYVMPLLGFGSLLDGRRTAFLPLPSLLTLLPCPSLALSSQDPLDAAFEAQYKAKEASREKRAASTYASRMAARGEALRPLLRHLGRGCTALAIERWQSQALFAAQGKEHESLLQALDSEWQSILAAECKANEKDTERSLRREMVCVQVHSRSYFLLWVRLARLVYLERGLWAWRNQATSSMLLSALNEVVSGHGPNDSAKKLLNTPRASVSGTTAVGEDGVPVVYCSPACFLSASPVASPPLVGGTSSTGLIRLCIERELLRWRAASLRFGMAVWCGNTQLRAQQRQTRRSRLEISKVQQDSMNLSHAERLRSSLEAGEASAALATLSRVALFAAVTSWHAQMRREEESTKIAEQERELDSLMEEVERSRRSLLPGPHQSPPGFVNVGSFSASCLEASLGDSRQQDTGGGFSTNKSIEDEAAWIELIKMQAEAQSEFHSSRGGEESPMARGGGSGTLSSDRLQASIMRLEERATMLQEEGLRAALDRSRAELEAERVENKALQAALAELSGRATIQERELDDKLALENALHDLSSQLTMQQSELSELREERELATGARDSMQAILRETVESCEEREAGSEAAMQEALRSMTSLEEEAIRIRAERDEL